MTPGGHPSVWLPGNARNASFNHSKRRLNHLPVNIPFRVDAGNPSQPVHETIFLNLNPEDDSNEP
jgi:hypothetical protein